MSIWSTKSSPKEINQRMLGTMCEHLDLKVTEVGTDYLVATMPVDQRTQQHMGIIHGGASVVLAETLGSIGAGLCCKPGYYAVGLDINANHLRPGKPPYVKAIAKPLHIGGSTMVWEIKIYDAEESLICISRLTAAILKTKQS